MISIQNDSALMASKIMYLSWNSFYKIAHPSIISKTNAWRRVKLLILTKPSQGIIFPSGIISLRVKVFITVKLEFQTLAPSIWKTATGGIDPGTDITVTETIKLKHAVLLTHEHGWAAVHRRVGQSAAIYEPPSDPYSLHPLAKAHKATQQPSQWAHNCLQIPS